MTRCPLHLPRLLAHWSRSSMMNMRIIGCPLQGRMCLLLSPPDSGKSSLLKFLAGKIRDSKLVKVSLAVKRHFCTNTSCCSQSWSCFAVHCIVKIAMHVAAFVQTCTAPYHHLINKTACDYKALHYEICLSVSDMALVSCGMRRFLLFIIAKA